MTANEIKSMISDGIPDCFAEVEGEDGTHFSAIIVSDSFTGKTMVQQHQLVYRTLGDKMGKEIHALSIQTFTPDEWQKKQALKIS